MSISSVRCIGHVQVRGLAHPEHWQGPQGALFDRFGAVKASPMAAYKLLRQGESVLLFPGGGREVRLVCPQPKHPLLSGPAQTFISCKSCKHNPVCGAQIRGLSDCPEAGVQVKER